MFSFRISVVSLDVSNMFLSAVKIYFNTSGAWTRLDPVGSSGSGSAGVSWGQLGSAGVSWTPEGAFGPLTVFIKDGSNFTLILTSYDTNDKARFLLM